MPCATIGGMDPGLVSRLVDGDGARLLAELGPYAESQALATASRLRAQGHDADLVAAVLAQARLRARAAATFGDQAATMLFTADGLEQATRPQLAARHAQRFAAAGIRTVHDLTCGIGSDAMAFAGRRARRRGHRRRPDHGGHRLGEPAALAARDRADRAGRAGGPARQPGRPAYRRMARPRPPPQRGGRPPRAHAAGRSRCTRCRRPGPRCSTSPRACPRPGPSCRPSFSAAARPKDAEAQWTSWRGEVLECAVWWGPLARLRGRSAAVCRPAATRSPPSRSSPRPTRPATHRCSPGWTSWLRGSTRPTRPSCGPG